jgi:hypothetical protein
MKKKKSSTYIVYKNQNVGSSHSILDVQSFYIVTCRGDYRRGLDWWIDLLTTYSRNYK